MSVTLSEARRAVRELLDEETPQSFKDAYLDRLIHEGCVEIARSSEVLEATATIIVVASTREYSMPADMIRAHRVDFETTDSGHHATLTYRDFHNANAVQWHGDIEGMPSLYTMWGTPGSVNLVLYPSPAYAGTVTVPTTTGGFWSEPGIYDHAANSSGDPNESVGSSTHGFVCTSSDRSGNV